MIKFAKIEDAIIARLRAFLTHEKIGYTVRDIQGYAGSFDVDDESSIAAALKQLPGVLVNFAGTGDMLNVGAKKHAPLRWQIIIATTSTRGADEGRKSEDVKAPGAYLISGDAMAALDGSDLGLEDVDGLVEAMDVKRVLQLRNGIIKKQRLVVYVIEAECVAVADRAPRGTTLAEFMRNRADWDVPPHGETHDFRQNITIRSPE